MTYIPSRIDAPIDVNVVSSGRPTAGRTSSLIANSINYLNHNKFMRQYHIPVENYESSSQTYDPARAGRRPIIYHRLWNSPTATRLFVGVWHMAALEEKGGSSYLIIGLHKTDGTLIDSRTYDPTFLHQVGVEQKDGYFPLPDIGYLSTGWEGDTFDISNYRAEELELRISQVYCRVFGIDVIEVYEGEV